MTHETTKPEGTAKRRREASELSGLVMREHSRYPYTYCADYLRMEVGDDYGRGLPSRSAMARLKSVIAEAIGMDEEELAKKLADKHIERYGA